MVAMVTANEGKPKPCSAPGGAGMSIQLSSIEVSARPKASAASQCAAAIQRRRHSSQARASEQAGSSTARSPRLASPAIIRSASGLRSELIAEYTDQSSTSGPPWPSTIASSANQAQPIASRQAASSASDADSGRFGSISARA